MPSACWIGQIVLIIYNLINYYANYCSSWFYFV